MPTQTLEQERAEFSYDCVKEIASNTDDLIPKKKFKGLVKKTPTYILTNGLGNTIAFLFSKGKNEHLALAYIIGKYLFDKNQYTKNIFQADELFNEPKEKFFNYLKNLQELNRLKDEFKFKQKEINKLRKELENSNDEQKFREKISTLEKEKIEEEFNKFLEKFKEEYSKFFDEETVNNGNIENFNQGLFINSLKNKMQNSLFKEVIFTNTDKYILATEETLRLLNWLRRFVEAMIEGEE